MLKLRQLLKPRNAIQRAWLHTSTLCIEVIWPLPSFAEVLPYLNIIMPKPSMACHTRTLSWLCITLPRLCPTLPWMSPPILYQTSGLLCNKSALPYHGSAFPYHRSALLYHGSAFPYHRSALLLSSLTIILPKPSICMACHIHTYLAMVLPYSTMDLPFPTVKSTMCDSVILYWLSCHTLPEPAKVYNYLCMQVFWNASATPILRSIHFDLKVFLNEQLQVQLCTGLALYWFANELNGGYKCCSFVRFLTSCLQD